MSSVLDEAEGCVRRFSEKGGYPVREPGQFGEVEADERSLRFELLLEEWTEYITAEGANDEVAIADALADMLYIMLGTAHSYGIPLGEVFAEVHRSNMAKFSGRKLFSKSGKLLKPDGWTPPDVEGVLKRAAERSRRDKERCPGG